MTMGRGDLICGLLEHQQRLELLLAEIQLRRRAIGAEALTEDEWIVENALHTTKLLIRSLLKAGGNHDGCAVQTHGLYTNNVWKA